MTRALSEPRSGIGRLIDYVGGGALILGLSLGTIAETFSVASDVVPDQPSDLSRNELFVWWLCLWWIRAHVYVEIILSFLALPGFVILVLYALGRLRNRFSRPGTSALHWLKAVALLAAAELGCVIAIVLGQPLPAWASSGIELAAGVAAATLTLVLIAE